MKGQGSVVFGRHMHCVDGSVWEVIFSSFSKHCASVGICAAGPLEFVDHAIFV